MPGLDNLCGGLKSLLYVHMFMLALQDNRYDNQRYVLRSGNSDEVYM